MYELNETVKLVRLALDRRLITQQQADEALQELAAEPGAGGGRRRLACRSRPAWC